MGVLWEPLQEQFQWNGGGGSQNTLRCNTEVREGILDRVIAGLKVKGVMF